jgi:hypothetical protein
MASARRPYEVRALTHPTLFLFVPNFELMSNRQNQYDIVGRHRRRSCWLSAVRGSYLERPDRIVSRLSLTVSHQRVARQPMHRRTHCAGLTPRIYNRAYSAFAALKIGISESAAEMRLTYLR